MTPQAVGLVRRVLAEMLRDAPVPVFRYLPASADFVPCLAVGRPALTVDADTSALAALTVPVYALGTTVGDDEAQEELDALGDLLVARYWSPPPVEGLRAHLTDLDPATVDVAGVTVPVYSASVSVRLAFC
jgi:hypothetical protein